jgi:hypothetical protein
MKRTLLLLLILFSTFTVYSQTWVDLGLKGGYGLNFLFNQNAFDDRDISYNFSFGHSFGGKIGLNFNEANAITLDIMSSGFNQTFNYNYLNADSSFSRYQRKLSLNTLDFMLLYRRTTEASYFEIGPQYSLLSKAKLNDNFNGSGPQDVSRNFKDSYYSAVMGFGSYIAGGDNFGITMGFRFSYTLNDIMGGAGTEFLYNKSYSTEKSTSPFTALFIMEFNYDMGHFAKANCKKRSKFLMF